MWNWLKRLFTPTQQTLSTADIFEVHDKLCFALGRHRVDLIKLTFQSGAVSYFCAVKVLAQQIYFGTMSKEVAGKLGLARGFYYIGPIGNGEFSGTSEKTERGQVMRFLGLHFYTLPRGWKWEVVEREPQAIDFKLWSKPDECFADALVKAKQLESKAIIVHGNAGGHAAALQRLGNGYRITDYVRENGKLANSSRLDLVAQEVLPTTQATSAFLVTL